MTTDIVRLEELSGFSLNGSILIKQDIINKWLVEIVSQFGGEPISSIQVCSKKDDEFCVMIIFSKNKFSTRLNLRLGIENGVYSKESEDFVVRILNKSSMYKFIMEMAKDYIAMPEGVRIETPLIIVHVGALLKTLFKDQIGLNWSNLVRKLECGVKDGTISFGCDILI